MTDGFVFDVFDDALVIIPLGEARPVSRLERCAGDLGHVGGVPYQRRQ
jgi:hypothetical protein